MESRGVIKWEPNNAGSSKAFFAVSGTLVIGHVGQRADGSCYYALTEVGTRSAKCRGEVAGIATAKRAVRRAWNVWLAEAGLTTIQG
jgi:hypothetical protein